MLAKTKESQNFAEERVEIDLEAIKSVIFIIIKSFVLDLHNTR